MLRSTALSGAVVTEIFGTGYVQLFGQKQRGHVYVNGAELAIQAPLLGEALYVPTDPSGVVNLSVAGGQLDPLGSDVGTEDPYLPETDPGFGYPYMGDISDAGGGCVRNGAPTNCSRAIGRSRLSQLLGLFLPRLSRWRPRLDPGTPSTFPTSQTTLGSIFRDVVSGSGLGDFLYPAAGATAPFVPRGSLYANPQTGAIEQPLNEDQAKLVWNALEEARKALLDDDCRRYVGERAYQELRKLWDNKRFTYFPGVQGAADEPEFWAANRGRGTFRGGSFTPRRITLGSHWFNDDDVQNGPNGAAAYGITPIQRRAANLLHEVRHVLGKNYIEDHDQWTTDIINNCFKKK